MAWGTDHSSGDRTDISTDGRQNANPDQQDSCAYSLREVAKNAATRLKASPNASHSAGTKLAETSCDEEGYTIVEEDATLLELSDPTREAALSLDQNQAMPARLSDSPREIEGTFTHGGLRVPDVSNGCRGIRVKGRVIRTFVFSTDLAIIRNCDADAVLAVYPFTCQPSITQALLHFAERPVFTGVSGTKTRGFRSVELATFSEMQGASGVVVNRTSDCETIRSIAEAVDIPIVVTAYELDDDTRAMIEAGAHIINVAAGKSTPEVVAQVRASYPNMPIIASGGKDEDSMRATIGAGADALTWSPPSLHELERTMMAANRAMVASEQIAPEPSITTELLNESDGCATPAGESGSAQSAAAVPAPGSEAGKGTAENPGSPLPKRG